MNGFFTFGVTDLDTLKEVCTESGVTLAVVTEQCMARKIFPTFCLINILSMFIRSLFLFFSTAHDVHRVRSWRKVERTELIPCSNQVVFQTSSLNSSTIYVNSSRGCVVEWVCCLRLTKHDSSYRNFSGGRYRWNALTWRLNSFYATHRLQNYQCDMCGGCESKFREVLVMSAQITSTFLYILLTLLSIRFTHR